jgi:hypothetical protein
MAGDINVPVNRTAEEYEIGVERNVENFVQISGRGSSRIRPRDRLKARLSMYLVLLKGTCSMPASSSSAVTELSGQPLPGR